MTIPWNPPAPYVGKHRAPKPTVRPVAPLAPRRPLDIVELECAALFTVLRHLEDGRSIDDAWQLGTIDALDVLTSQQVSQR